MAVLVYVTFSMIVFIDSVDLQYNECLQAVQRTRFLSGLPLGLFFLCTDSKGTIIILDTDVWGVAD